MTNLFVQFYRCSKVLFLKQLLRFFERDGHRGSKLFGQISLNLISFFFCRCDGRASVLAKHLRDRVVTTFDHLSLRRLVNLFFLRFKFFDPFLDRCIVFYKLSVFLRGNIR